MNLFIKKCQRVRIEVFLLAGIYLSLGHDEGLPERTCPLWALHTPAAGWSRLSGPVDLAVFSQLYSPAGHQLEGGRKDLMFC